MKDLIYKYHTIIWNLHKFFKKIHNISNKMDINR